MPKHTKVAVVVPIVSQTLLRRGGPSSSSEGSSSTTRGFTGIAYLRLESKGERQRPGRTSRGRGATCRARDWNVRGINIRRDSCGYATEDRPPHQKLKTRFQVR